MRNYHLLFQNCGVYTKKERSNGLRLSLILIAFSVLISFHPDSWIFIAQPEKEVLDFLVDLPQLLFQVVRDMVISFVDSIFLHEKRGIVTTL